MKRSASSRDSSKSAPALAGLQDFLTALNDAVHAGQFQRLVLSSPRQQADWLRATIRPVEISGRTHYQWTDRRGPQELHRNLSADELAAHVAATFPAQFINAHAFTTKADLVARLKGATLRLKRQPPSLKTNVPAAHNRERNYLLSADEPVPFLIASGVQLPSGQIRPAMFHKFRQINRYLEFVRDVVPAWPANQVLKIVDFGCGKSYLTFALHHYLTKIADRRVQILGLDLKGDVVTRCQQLAEELHCDGLRFEVGHIADSAAGAAVDMAISLHACDTATDESIAAAISRQATVIFAVPCCQHELSRMLPEGLLPGLNEYGLLRDRFATLATDSLRARFLDASGYDSQILEFIELEHTPKNVLIRAVRRPDGLPVPRSRERYQQLKEQLGITDWALEQAAARRGVGLPTV